MTGTIVNVITVLIGTTIGVFLKKGIKDEYKNILMNGMALVVLLIGISGSIKTKNILLVIVSIAIGSILGQWIDIEKRLDSIGNKLRNKIAGKNDSKFSEGFVTATLLYCVGAMAIVGALESGTQGNHETLFAKAAIDGLVSIILASTLGIGVAFSVIPILIYQGGITLLAKFVKDFLTPDIINEMSAIGSLLIVGIAINMLEIKKIKVGNMLLSIFIPLIYYLIVSLFNRL